MAVVYLVIAITAVACVGGVYVSASPTAKIWWSAQTFKLRRKLGLAGAAPRASRKTAVADDDDPDAQAQAEAASAWEQKRARGPKRKPPKPGRVKESSSRTGKPKSKAPDTEEQQPIIERRAQRSRRGERA